MSELRLMGGPGLRCNRGIEIRSVLAQPKRLALLVYLLLGKRPGVHERDSLLALFWPEQDNAHARASLRKALHFLRAELGAGVIQSHGQSLVGVAEAGLACDVVAFWRAVAAGRNVEAVELYRGEILPGFFVAGAPDFEQWLDQERARTRAAALECALKLVDGELDRGSAGLALLWARAAELISPENESVTRRVITLLEREGDRAGAVRKYEDFARRLEREYGMKPSAETRELVEGIRRSGASAGLPLSANGHDGRPAQPDRFEELVDSLEDVVYETDADGCFTYINAAGARLSGYSRRELMGKLYLEVVREDYRDRALSFYLLQFQQRTPTTYFEFPGVAKDGREVWLGQNVQLLMRDGEPAGVRAVARDITARKRGEEVQRNLTVQDRATGLPNRRALQLLIEHRLHLARRNNTPLVLIVVELLNYRDLRAASGAGKAEEAIANLARLVRATCRDSDIVARAEENAVGIVAFIQEDGVEVLRRRLESARVEAEANLRLPEALALRLHVVARCPPFPDSAEAMLQLLGAPGVPRASA